MTDTAPYSALVAGATGATGRLLVQRLLEDPHCQRLHLIHYRPTGFTDHPKVSEHLLAMEDLENLEIEGTIERVFCCLGSTLKRAGSVAAFVRVDRDYVVALGRWAQQQQVEQFHVISSLGSRARSPNYYSRTKGEMEQALRALALPALAIYHPSMLHAHRDPPRLNETLSFPLVRLLCRLPGLRRFRPLPVEDLAAAMHRQSQQAFQGTVVIRSESMQGAARSNPPPTEA
ncbi:NAD(P)H-binding protein [Aestuariirhabdus litorea]|uniref:Short chain dehydrogenase n=1 Tax=Aestuariirhabdus litorea TaxID=2528527 RepID=A0A3P3VM04_9GAMM|nr:NAD(P)H-binding protein [Aestuariirhabdus litorea]RRJ83765.1 short chain dehydrogenase [Aestuariirhabdus litorea]RWW96988.1 short chain dehydrogenase [Endozoicomonadaceae bacterium GTF-13]